MQVVLLYGLRLLIVLKRKTLTTHSKLACQPARKPSGQTNFLEEGNCLAGFPVAVVMYEESSQIAAFRSGL